MKSVNVKGFGKFLLTMFLAVLLLLTCFLPCTMVRATDIDDMADENRYEKLYYFSDYAESTSFGNNVIVPILTVYGLTANDLELHYWSNGEIDVANRFWAQFKRYMSDNVNQIQNAFVIVEIRSGFEKHPDNGWYELQTPYLKDVFETLKAHDCKIMFISGTDECRYSLNGGYNEFLDYVDIHICNDLMPDFIYNVLYRMQRDYGGIQTILLKKSMENIIEEFLIPYFRYVGNYSAIDYANGYHLVENVLADSGVRILIQTGNDEFTDYITEDTYDFEDIVDQMSNGLCAIGDTWEDSSVTLLGAFGEAWLYLMVNNRIEQEMSFPIFVYNTTADLSSYRSESNLYILDHLMYLSDSILEEIVETFILGGDLSIYNNCFGRCIVTYKPITFGEDGWMIIGRGDLSGWQTYMEEEEWMFYFGEIF